LIQPNNSTKIVSCKKVDNTVARKAFEETGGQSSLPLFSGSLERISHL
jgi:hypothetical protein